MNLLNELTPAEFDDLLVQALLGATVLLMSGMVGVVVAGARSAALRHRIWTLSMIAALAFPVFALLLPSFGPQWPTISAAQTGRSSNNSLNVDAHFQRPNAKPRIRLRPAAGPENMIDSQPELVESTLPLGSAPADPEAASVFSHIQRTPGVSPAPENESLGIVLIAVWLAGLTVGLFILVKSQLSAALLVRRAIPVTNRRTLELAKQVGELAGIGTSVPILVSSEVTVPVTFGCLRPVIVLPSGYGQWTTERCHAVLAHELAHVRRRDVLSQQTARLASVVYWCQPLVWFASWRMRIDREFACDDAVLHMGESPRGYACHLLEVASAVCGHSHTPSCVAIASKGDLECRIKAILHPHLSRGPVSLRTGRTLTAAAGMIVVVFCLLTPARSNSNSFGESAIFTASAESTSLLGESPDTREPSLGQGIAELSMEGNFADHDRRAVVLRFPSDHAIGVVYVQDYGKDIRQEPQRWAYARGNVRVPVGKQIRLDIGAASRHDLSPLRELSPNSLDMLSIREADIDDAALESIGLLSGLKSILFYCCRIEDAATGHFTKLSNLEILDLTGSVIRDDSLAQLESLENLVELNLGYTKTITDRGMHYVGKLKSLRSLDLARTQVTDSGLARLEDMVSLRSLNLGSIQFVSDSGMANLAKLTNLRDLDLSCYMRDGGQPVTDRGLAHLVGLKELRRLDLSGVALTDAGLVYLQTLSNLEQLRLPSGPSGAGLQTIGKLTSLRRLEVSNAMASDLGLSHLTRLQNLEHLNLWCDGRVTDRGVAYLQQIGSLKTLGLHGSAVTDEGLLSLAQLKSLEDLRLHGNEITFDGLRYLAEFPTLRRLSFSRLRGRSGSLRHLQKLQKLKSLRIGSNPQLSVDGFGTELADEGLSYLSGLTDLEHLSLSSITVTDEGIEHLSGFRSLETLHLANSGNSFTDIGLECLVDMKRLRELYIRGSITDRGLVHLTALESLQTTNVQGTRWGTISDVAMETLSECLPSMNKVYNFWRPRT